MSESPSRLQTYLALGHDVSATAQALAERVTEIIRGHGIIQSFRDRALTGLALKIDSAFEALLIDAEAFRSEAMHHLAEAHVYFRAIAADASGATAELVLASAYGFKAEMLREGRAAAAEIAKAERLRNEYLNGRPALKKGVRGLARAHGLEDWYWRIYRLACEPAHLGDLVEFMPAEGSELRIGGAPAAAGYRALVAVHYGIIVMLALFDEINGRNEAGLHVPVEQFRERLNAIVSGNPHPQR
jgi:hypothetical protein